MPFYAINLNAQSGSRDNEVHERTCSYIRQSRDLKELGFHYSCHEAVADAKRQGHHNADGCYYCCRPCNTG